MNWENLSSGYDIFWFSLIARVYSINHLVGKALGSLIAVTRTLESLEVQFNPFNEEGCLALAQGGGGGELFWERECKRVN